MTALILIRVSLALPGNDGGVGVCPEMVSIPPQVSVELLSVPTDYVVVEVVVWLGKLIIADVKEVIFC